MKLNKIIKILFPLFWISIIALSFYLFLMLNLESHKLNKDEYSFKIYQLEEHEWIDFKKDINGSSLKQKEIKSSLLFKKEGKLLLRFSFLEKAKESKLSFKIEKNEKQIDAFSLKKGKKHQTLISIKKSDRVTIYVKTDGTEPYWGTVHTDFTTFSFNIDDATVPFLWMVVSLFLFYKHYGYLAIFSYFIFAVVIVSERLNFEIVDNETVFFYSFTIFFITFLYLFLYQLFDRFKRFRVSFLFLYIITSILLVTFVISSLYVFNFGNPLSESILYAIFQTNVDESFEYLEKFVEIKYIFLFVGVYFLMAWLLYKQEQKEKKRVEYSTLILLILIFFSLSFSQRLETKLLPFIYEYSSKYMEELASFRAIQEKRKSGQLQFKATKEAKGETYIVVIGESLNKNHMGLYGYMRDTTPILSEMNQKKELLVYDNSYSNHVHTVQVLSLALTEANQYNKKDYFDSLSIIDILNKSNFETYWLTNQTLYGGWDNMVSAIGTTAKHIVSLNSHIGYTLDTENYDELLISEVKKILAKKSDKNRVIFVHLMGNHSCYDSRYPNDKFSYFSKPLKKEDFGKNLMKNSSINIYDNSIRYTDYVVGSILKELQKIKAIGGFLFFSDHADDIDKDLAHSIDNFTYEMTEIPLLFWFNDGYKREYINRYKSLVKHQKSLFSNDMLYDTMVGFLGVQTNKYGAKYDLSSRDYILEENRSLVTHGKRHYTEEANHHYWQRKNIEYLKISNQIDSIIPMDIHTLGKYREVVESGFKRIQMNILVEDKILLEKIFAKLEEDKIEEISLYYSNIDKANYRKVFDDLKRLDNKFQIKKRVVLEWSLEESLLKEFIDDGWKSCSVLNRSKKRYLGDIDFQKEKIDGRIFVDFNSSYF